MKRITRLVFVAMSALLIIGNVQISNAQDVDLEKYPDYKPFDPALQKHPPVTVSRGSAKSNSNVQLPDHLNNALSMFYPPVFNQSGGSCGSAQAVGYIFTHDMNNMRNTDASYEENQYPSHFTWLFTHAGHGKSSIMSGNGVPNVATYGGRTYSSIFGYQDTKDYYFGWMNGYDKWFNAMHNRLLDFFYGPKVSATDKSAQEELKLWLYNHWGEGGYIEGGCAGIGVASGITSARIPSTPTNNELGVTNMYYVNTWGKTYDHGVTVCGYDDRIEFDLDGDGICGEEDANEKGAWIICNSWGNWMNAGFIYCPYAHTYCMLDASGNPSLSWGTELYHYRHDYRPLRTIKVTMDYDHRWELSLSGGMSQDTSATVPEKTCPFAHFEGSDKFDEGGVSPECPMLGKWQGQWNYDPMEFGYDLTDLGEVFDKTKPIKYFFYVTTRTGSVGSGHVYNASILNYEFDKDNPLEIPFKIDTVSIDKGGVNLCFTVIVPGEATNPPLNANLTDKTLTWSAPEVSSLPITKYYIYNSGELCDSVTAARKSYTVSDADGNYTVAAVYNYKGLALVSKPSNNASNPIILDNTDNKILTLTNGSIVIPNALTSKLNQATIEFMIKANSLSSSSNKIGDNNSSFFVFPSASGQISAGWSTGSSTDYASTAAGTIKTGKWYHVAVVINQSEISIYVDGMRKKQVTSGTYSGLPALGDLVIGLTNGEMNCSIDEFRIWNTARQMTELFAAKDDAIANPSAYNNLVVYLPMELIEDNGEIKVREYASGKHAYFADPNSYAQSTDATILKGSKLAVNPSIIASQDSAAAGTPVLYTASCPVNTTKWSWSAPGAQSTTFNSQAPYITYNTPGEYTISLTITKSDGTTQDITKDVVVTEAGLPVVDFDIAKDRQDAGKLFSFVNRSSGANTSYVWTLEGAQASTLRTYNATAIYDIPGTYNVTLTGTNASGSVSTTKTVTIDPAAPEPNFTVSPSNILLGETTYVVDNSNGNVTNWTWTLGNGKRSVAIIGQNSSYTPVAPGFYDVTLTAGNDVGQKSLTSKKALCVSNADAKNALSFTGSEKVQFTCPLTTNSKAWTISWWMNPLQYTGAGSFETENGFFRMNGIAKGAYKLTLNGASVTTQEGYVIINEWHHYAVTYSLGTVKFYRDGELWEAPTNKVTYTTGKWEGNMYISSQEMPFKGLIDECHIWIKALSGTNIKNYCNAPINNPESTAGLALYYNFNQGSGDVTDLGLQKLNGTRIGFGPDGDAWPVTPGVFTLDTDAPSVVVTDVSSEYLTNYKRPFLYSDEQVNNTYPDRYMKLLTGTETSGWETAGSHVEDDITTGFYVDRQYNTDLMLTTGYSNFDFNANDARAWQTVTLPAGKYKFSGYKGSSTYSDYGSKYILAAYGNTIPTSSSLTSAIATDKFYNTMSTDDAASIEFLLGQETEVSLGVLFNISDSYFRFGIKEFKLERQAVEIITADGETSIYESIANGTSPEAYARDGGIMIASETKKNFKIYNLSGQCVFNNEAQGVHFLPFEKGIYIVNGIKVIVK